MTTKFKPFDPTTAKNGDIVYISCYESRPYKYIGPDVVSKDASVIHNDSGYGWDFNSKLMVKVPKKTVWINLYRDSDKHGMGYFYPTEDEAVRKKMTNSFIGTYSIEIDVE